MEINSNLNNNTLKVFPWTITNRQEAQLMLAAAPGEYFESNVIHYNDLKFVLRVYPNGMKKEHEGKVNVYLELESMPIAWKSVLLTQRISCTSTGGSKTFLVEYTPENVSWGWPSSQSPVTTAELRKTYYESGMLGFQVEIDALRVKLLANDKIIYQNPFPYLSKQISEIYWDIPKNDIIAWFNSDNSTLQYESPIVDNLWCLTLERGRGQSQDSIGVFLKLCGLPANVNSLQVKVQFESRKLKSNECIENTFSMNRKSWGKKSFAKWTPYKLNYETSIDIHAKIEVLNEVNLDGLDLVSLEWIQRQKGQYVGECPGADNNEYLQHQIDSLSQEIQELKQQINVQQNMEKCGCFIM